jgi:hypothetical protein
MVHTSCSLVHCSLLASALEEGDEDDEALDAIYANWGEAPEGTGVQKSAACASRGFVKPARTWRSYEGRSADVRHACRMQWEKGESMSCKDGTAPAIVRMHACIGAHNDSGGLTSALTERCASLEEALQDAARQLEDAKAAEALWQSENSILRAENVILAARFVFSLACAAFECLPQEEPEDEQAEHCVVRWLNRVRQMAG